MFFLHVSVASHFFSALPQADWRRKTTLLSSSCLFRRLWAGKELSSSGVDLRELWSSGAMQVELFFLTMHLWIYTKWYQCVLVCLKRIMWITSFTGKLSLIVFLSIEVWIKILYPKELISCPRGLRFCSIAIWPQPEVTQSHLVITWSWVKILPKRYPKS